MTTNELLWNAYFENTDQIQNCEYKYSEELNMEKYYEEKELFERLNNLLKPAI